MPFDVKMNTHDGRLSKIPGTVATLIPRSTLGAATIAFSIDFAISSIIFHAPGAHTILTCMDYFKLVSIL